MNQKLYGVLTDTQLKILVGNQIIEGFLFNESVLVWIMSPKSSIQEVIKRLKHVWYPYDFNPIVLEVLDFRTDVVQFYKINKIIDHKKYMVLV